MREIAVHDLYGNTLAKKYPEFDQYYTKEEISSIIFAMLKDAINDEELLEHACHAVLLYGALRFKEGEMARYFPGHYEDAWDDDMLDSLSVFMEENAFLEELGDEE